MTVKNDLTLMCQDEEVEGLDTQNADIQRSNEVPAMINPVLTQPGPGVARTTFTTITQMGGEWSTGLLDVCGDKTTCNRHPQTTHKHITNSALMLLIK